MADELAYSVTGADMQRWGLPYQRWSAIAQMPAADIRRFLDEYGALGILYEEEPHSGHWVVLTRRGPDHLEFLDSYGLAPDAELEYADYSGSQACGRQLLRMSLSQWPTVEYLGTPVQQWKRGVNTCGRYCLARWLDREPPLGEWLRKYGFRRDDGPANDQRVIELTRELL